MRYGSLFSGVGGLDLAVEQVLGASCAWHSEIDPHASKVLAAHWPGVPNHGDITAIDWTAVEPVDVLCGGFPCQDISSAGRMAGIKEGTRSGLWYSYADAIRVLRPRLVVVENVGALLVRGLDIVLGSLAELGYVGSWRCLRASAVGAPHRRERFFLVAAPADAGTLGWLRRSGVEGSGRDASERGQTGCVAGDGHQARDLVDLLPTPTTAPSTGNGHARSLGGEVRTLLPTPTCSLGGSRGTPSQETARRRIEDEGRRGLDDAVALLPTPAAMNPNDGEQFATWEARRLATKARTGNGNGFGMPLSIAVQLLPTPRARDHKGPGYGDDLPTQATTNWGRYAAAVARWEHLTRPAPSPTDDRGRLNAELPEWMMGFNAGWITDVLDRPPALRAAGNAVCRQQAAVAIDDLLATLAATWQAAS